MKKKILVIITCLFIATVFCLTLTACNNTVEEITTESGATVEGGSFAKGSTLTADIVNDEETVNTVKTAIASQDYKKSADVFVYDISVLTDGAKVQPNGKVKVTIPAPLATVTRYFLFHVKDDGSSEKLTANYEDGKIWFETESFSYFVVVEDFGAPTTIKVHLNGTGTHDAGITVNGINEVYDGVISVVSVYSGEVATLTASIPEACKLIGWYQYSYETEATAATEMLSVKSEYSFTIPEGLGEYDIGLYIDARERCDFYVYSKPTAAAGLITVNGGGANGYVNEYLEGTKLALTATPATGYNFIGWYMADATVASGIAASPLSVATSFEFTVSKDEETVYAVYEEIPVPEKFTLTVGQQGAGGSIQINDLSTRSYESQAYSEDFVTDTDITLIATTRSADYRFLGWFEPNEVVGTTFQLSETAVSTSATYEFTTGESAYTVYAVFEAIVTGLQLDGVNSGFASEGTTVYVIGETAINPNPATVVVYGVKATGNATLTKDTDYTVDIGGLDLTAVGSYTITYTYIKNTELKATLTVSVENPKYLFSATVDGQGSILEGTEVLPNGYSAEHEEGETVTLTAKAATDYEFLGWYTTDTTPALISTNSEYTFTVGSADQAVSAKFGAKVVELVLDGANAGFVNGSIAYEIGSDDTEPDLDSVIVYGLTVGGNVALTKGTDYTVSGAEDVDYTVVGAYTVSYYFIKDNSITSTLTINVVAASAVNVAFTGLMEDSEKYNGGTAAFVNKTMFTINGVACSDITTTDGISYEWRDHATGDVVEAADDFTLNDNYILSPAVVGVYDFVVYRTADELKTPLVTVTRTITTNLFELATARNQINGGYYYCNIIVGIVDGNYYVMRMPSSAPVTHTDPEGILVSADESGNLIVGDEYAYTFITYHFGNTQRHAPRDDTSPDTLLYDFRTGRGPYQAGALLLYSSGISFGNANGDSGVLISFNSADNTANISEPFMMSNKIRLVYDTASNKYLFTSSTATETRTTYPVYIYREYIPYVAPTEVYKYNGQALDKEYDGTAVTVNAYKDLEITTENNEDLFSLIKAETGRLAWLDATELTEIEGVDGTIAEDGTVTGPSAVGSYVLVLQVAVVLKDGNTYWENKTLCEFTISEASTGE